MFPWELHQHRCHQQHRHTQPIPNPKPLTYIVCAHASTSRMRNGSRVAVMPKYLTKCFNLNAIGAQSMADVLTSPGGT
jgi:hypothetical protein